MKKDLLKIYAELKKRGLTPEEEERILAEIRFQGTHDLPEGGAVREPGSGDERRDRAAGIYGHHDLTVLQDMTEARGRTVENLYTYIYQQAWDNLDDVARRVLLLMPLVANQGAELDFLASMSGMPRGDLAETLQRLVALNLVHNRQPVSTEI